MLRFLQSEGPIKKIVLGGILVVICVMMVITLVPGGMFGEYFSGGVTQQGVLARVGDQAVSMTEVAQRARMIARQQFRGNVPPSLMPFLMQRAADSMITQSSLLYEADRMGLGASDQEVRDFLQQGQLGEIFFPGGNFVGTQEYENLVQNQFGLSVAQFEREVKTQIAQNKLLATIGATVTVSDRQITEEIQKQDTKVKFNYAVITLDDIKKGIHPTDAELQSFYEQNKQQYVNSIPEKRKARYVIIDKNKVGEGIQISQAELQLYYNQHQDEYRIPETVTVRHILIKTPVPGADGKVDQKGVDAAKAKADDIEKQVKSGADFAELAKKNSDDPGSAPNGGLLPPITRGRTVPEFEQAAFSTPVGQMTGVIRTSYGFHIIKVEGKQSARLKPLDEVRAQIEPALKQQKAAAATQKLADTVQSLARTSNLEKAAADKGLTVTTTDMLEKGGPLPGAGIAPDLTNAIFEMKKNDPPATATIPAGYAVYQVIDIQPPQTPTFEQIKAKVEDQFKSERAQAVLAQKTQEMADRAHAEHDLAKAAKELGATMKASDLVGTSSQVPEMGALTGPAAVVFTLKPGEISGPISTQSGGLVVALLERQEPSPDELKKGWDSAKETLLSQKRQEMEGLYVQNLRERLEKEGKIKINKAEMERLSKMGGES